MSQVDFESTASSVEADAPIVQHRARPGSCGAARDGARRGNG